MVIYTEEKERGKKEVCMEELKEKIARLQKEKGEKEKAERMLLDLEDQRQELTQKVSLLNSGRIREQEDVDRLEHKGLTRFVLSLSDRYEEKLSQEKKEAYQALMKYETAKRELDGILYDISAAEAVIQSLAGCEEELEQALKEREKQAADSDAGFRDEIYSLHEELAVFESRKVELEEAIDAGRQAMFCVGSVIEGIDSAKNWGVADILGGGLIITLVKHSKIDDAQCSMEKLQVALRRFKNELSDVERIDGDLSIDFSDMLRFGDWFFDGLIFDIMVQNRLNTSRENVTRVRSKIAKALQALDKALNETEKKMLDIRMEINQKIIEQ